MEGGWPGLERPATDWRRRDRRLEEQREYVGQEPESRRD